MRFHCFGINESPKWIQTSSFLPDSMHKNVNIEAKVSKQHNNLMARWLLALTSYIKNLSNNSSQFKVSNSGQ